MDAVLQVAAVLLPLLYLGAAVSYGFVFFASSEAAGRLGRILFPTALAVHFLDLVLLWVRWGQFPAATVSQSLSAVAFAVAVVYALVEWRSGEAATGFWMLALVFLFELLSSLLHSAQAPDREILHSPLFAVHVSLGMVGYAAFVVAAAYGFLYLRLYSELKRGRFSVFFGKLPPLEVLGRLMTGALLAGFLALTGVVISGVVWAQQVYGSRWLADPKILFTLATWGFYGLALGLRRARQWQARQTAVASLAGLGAILFSVLAVNLFFTHLHDFQ